MSMGQYLLTSTTALKEMTQPTLTSGNASYSPNSVWSTNNSDHGPYLQLTLQRCSNDFHTAAASFTDGLQREGGRGT